MLDLTSQYNITLFPAVFATPFITKKGWGGSNHDRLTEYRWQRRKLNMESNCAPFAQVANRLKCVDQGPVEFKYLSGGQR